MMSKEAKRGGLPNSKKLELVRFGACTPSVAQIPIFQPLPGRLGPAIFAGAFGVCWRYPAHMGRHGGDDLHRIQIPAEERDKLILDLRRRGWTYARIGKYVGMSANGVSASLVRIQEGRPGRPPR